MTRTIERFHGWQDVASAPTADFVTAPTVNERYHYDDRGEVDEYEVTLTTDDGKVVSILRTTYADGAADAYNAVCKSWEFYR